MAFAWKNCHSRAQKTHESNFRDDPTQTKLMLRIHDDEIRCTYVDLDCHQNVCLDSFIL